MHALDGLFGSGMAGDEWEVERADECPAAACGTGDYADGGYSVTESGAGAEDGTGRRADEGAVGRLGTAGAVPRGGFGVAGDGARAGGVLWGFDYGCVGVTMAGSFFRGSLM